MEEIYSEHPLSEEIIETNEQFEQALEHYLDAALSSGDSVVLKQTQLRLEKDLEDFMETRKGIISNLRQLLPSAVARNGNYLYMDASRVKSVFARLTQSFQEETNGQNHDSVNSFINDLESHLITRRLSLDSMQLEVDENVSMMDSLDSKTEQEIVQFAVKKLLNNRTGILRLVQSYIKDCGLEQTRTRVAEILNLDSTSESFSFPILGPSLIPNDLPFNGTRRPIPTAGVNQDHQSLQDQKRWNEKLSLVQSKFELAPAALRGHLLKPNILSYAASYLQESSKPLRKHQIDFIQLCEQGGNFVFCAKTLEQKTKTLLSYAKFRLDRSQIRKLVVVEPTGTLVLKQAAVSILEGLSEAGYHIESCFDISTVISFQNVQIIITTPCLLIKNISYQNLDFDSIDLLILDEFHYCRGDRAYLLIMELCRTSISNRQCQVLGFTNITAMGSSSDPTVLGMELPLMQICAKYVTVTGDRDGIHVREPPPKDEVLFNGLCEDNLEKYRLSTQS
eukprot:g1683.t1